jgi:threonine aldolase
VPCGNAAAAAAAARAAGVLVGVVGARTLRLVTHLDVPTADAHTAGAVLARVLHETAA